MEGRSGRCGKGRVQSGARQASQQGRANFRPGLGRAKSKEGHEVKEHNGPEEQGSAGHLLLGCRAIFDRMPPHSHTSFCSGSLSKSPSDSTSVK